MPLAEMTASEAFDAMIEINTLIETIVSTSAYGDVDKFNDDLAEIGRSHGMSTEVVEAQLGRVLRYGDLSHEMLRLVPGDIADRMEDCQEAVFHTC